MMNMIAPNIQVEMINQLMGQAIAKNDSNLVVISFNKEATELPTTQGILSAIHTAQNEKLEAYVDNVKDEPLMTELPKPGKIVKEVENALLGYKELTLSNGAKVIIKPTDFKDDEIRYYAESKGGESLYDEKDWANLKMFDDVIDNSGLGNFSSNELQKALAGKNANVSLSMTTEYERLSGNSTKKDLETMFQMNYLYFTNIKKDEKSIASLLNRTETQLKAKGTVPEAAFSDSITYTLGNHNWRSKPFEVEDIQKVDYDRILQIAKERTANAADFTFYFVGSFDEATIKPLIEQYIASLPAQKGKNENFKDVKSYPTGVVVNEFTRKMETPKANTVVYWHSFLAPLSLENQLKADIAADVLDMVLLKKIREDEGAAYTTNAFGGCGKDGSKVQTMLIGIVPMKPEKKDVVMKVLHEVLGDMANGVEESAMSKIKEKMLKDYDTNAKSNGHWIGVLKTFVEDGLDTQTNYKEILNKITCADISKFVDDYLIKSGNRIEVTMMPEE